MRERDLLIWRDGMRDSFKIDGRMRDKKQKNNFTDLTSGTG